MNTCVYEFWVPWAIGMVCCAAVFHFIDWRRHAKFKKQPRKAKCKHEMGVRETQACDAICKQCGENLGFIGQWRKKHGIGGEE
jgi:hypothetical protein